MNIIEALVVTLSLDASGLKKGQKEASEALKKTREEAVKHGKDIEDAGKSAASFFSALTLEVGAFLGAVASTTALVNFLKTLNQINSATGRMAQALNSTPEALSTFGNAVERMGGDANTAIGSLQGLLDAFNDLRTTGNSALLPVIAQIQGRGGVKLDFARPLTEQLFALAENLKNIEARNPGLGFFFGKKLGLDEGTTRLLIQGRANLAKELAGGGKYAISKEQAEAAIKAARAWTQMAQAIRAFGSELLTTFLPGIQRLFKIIEWGMSFILDALRLIKSAGDSIAARIRAVFGDLSNAYHGFVDSISKSGPAILEAIKNAWNAALEWLKGKLSALGTLLGLLNPVSPAFGSTGAQSGAAAGVGGAGGGLSPGGGAGVTGPSGGQIQTGGAGIHARANRAKGNLAANQHEAYNAARAEGLSDAAARALVANMSGESLRNPRDHHWDRKHMSQGIVQWDPQRAEAIRQKFGKYPKDMSVAEQTRAAIWEINSNPRFARTKQALQGSNQGNMLDALVRNYEAPADARGAIAARTGYLRGLPSNLGARGAANINNSRNSTTSNQSSVETHIGSVNVHTQASDGPGVSRALETMIGNNTFAMHANYGAV